MLDQETKRKIDSARNILVGKVPDPKAQVEQITIALIYKFMDDMDKGSIELGGKARFFTGDYQKYSWSNIMDLGVGGFDRLSTYSEALIRMSQNPKLPQLFRDIFNGAFLPYRDPETLNLFLKEINGFVYEHSERLGDAFEYLLSILGSQGEAGQFRTPRHIIDFIVSVIEPKKDETILDPACGTAGFLISAYKYIFNQNKQKHPGDKLTPSEKSRIMGNCVGYDISPDMVRLSRVNMYLHGFPTPHIFEYDTLTSEEKWGDSYDVILANPPFMTPKGGIRPHKRFSVQAKRSEVLFVDYIAEHLNVHGRAGVIVPEGIIFQSANAYKALRKMLVDENYLFAVVSLPAGVFNPYSGVKTSILLMDKTLAKKTKNILFVKIENDGFDLGAQRRAIEKNDLPEAFRAICAYKKSLERGREFSFKKWQNIFVIEKHKIAENADYNLNGDRYSVSKVSTAEYPVVKLGEVAKIIAGQSPKGQFYNLECKGMPFYQGKTEFEDIYLGKPCKWTTQVTKEAIPNDILMSVRAPVGPVNICLEKICIGRGLAAIRPKNTLNYKYLFYLLKSKEGEIKGGGGSVFDSISKKQIEDIEIPLPPIEIQGKIVAEIDGYQKIIDGARQVVENYKPQIKIDPKWPVVALEEIADVTSSKRIFQNEYTASGIPFYRTKEIVELSQGKPISLELFISEKKYKEIKKKFNVPHKGEILISAVGTIGISWVVSEDREFYFKDGNLLWIKNLKNINPYFLKHVLDSIFSFRLNELIFGAAYKALTIIKLKQIQIPFPDLETQRHIVAQIDQEQKIINGNKKLIEIFEQKIKAKVKEVWGE